jgi:hypothetical protein
MGEILFLLQLLAKRVLIGQVVFELVCHVGSTIPVGLESSQFFDRIGAGHIRVSYRALDTDVVVTVAIDVHLEFLIYGVCVILRVQLSLHQAYVLLHGAVLVHQMAAISVDAVKFHQH